MAIAALLLVSACVEEIEPEPTRDPPEGMLVYEGECARVFQTFEGFVCQGTAERLDLRVCQVRDYLGGGPDLELVDLYLAVAEGEQMSDWCGQPGLGGCANGLVAFSLESSMNHEIVHVVAEAISGHDPHSILDEGLAQALDGKTHSLVEPPDLESLLSSNSGHKTHRNSATNFVGWILMTHGPEIVMRVASDAPAGSTRVELEAALSKHLGMSVDAIVAAYEADTAWTYPELPPLTPALTPEEWANGVEMNFECSETSQGLSGEPYMWRTVDFTVDVSGTYLFPFGDALAIWIDGVCEDPHFEDGVLPCEELGFGEFGFTYRRMQLDPERRYRARIEAEYPGPVSFTFLPMLEVDP